MRQLSNTSSTDRLEEELRQAGILQENIDWMVPYLDMTQPEQPELLERAKRQDPFAMNASEQYVCFELVRKWLQADITRERALKAFFAAAGPFTVGTFWGEITKITTPLEKILGPEGAAALYAGCWSHGMGKGAEKLLGVTPAAAKGALALCGGVEDPTRAVLAALWLSKQKPKGFLNTLFGGTDPSWAVAAVREYLIAGLQRLSKPQPVGILIGTGGVALSLPPQESAQLVDFVLRDEDVPLPVPAHQLRVTARGGGEFAAVGGACFLAMESSPELKTSFSLCAALCPTYTLQQSLALAGGNRFRAAVPWLIEHTPFSACLYPLARDSKELSKDLARQYPKVYEQAIRRADLNEADALLQVIRSVDPAWGDRVRLSNRASVQHMVIQNLSKCVEAADQPAMRAFLRRGEELDVLLARLPVGGGKNWGYQGAAEGYIRQYGADPFAVRILIAVSMVDMNYHVGSLWKSAVEGLPKDQKVGTLLDRALEAGLPALDCLRLAEAAEKGYYSDKDKQELLDQTARWLGTQPEEALRQAVEKGSAFARCAAVQVLARRGDVEALLPLAGDGSKQTRMLVVNALASFGQEKGGQAALTLLQAKKASQRETGLTVIDLLNQNTHGKFVQTCRPQLEQALEKEKSDKLAGVLRRLLGVPQEDGSAPTGELMGDPVAAALKGGKKRKVQWVLDAQLPPVQNRDGTPAQEDRLAAMMVCVQEYDPSAARTLATARGLSQAMSQTLEEKSQAAVRALDTARALARDLEPKSLESYAAAVYDHWMEGGAPSKQKWVLTFASLFGGRDMVDVLKRQIQQWPQEARGAIACEAVYALALSPEPEGLLLVDSISRKFKFKQVKTAAGAALGSAAKALGLSPEELADRIVPDLGLNQRGERTFDYGPRSFTVTLTPALELEVRTQDGKKLKTLPAPGKQDDPALAGASNQQFKVLKKQIKATVTTQALRLEQALSAARTWTGTAWRALFVQKPVMRQFAIGLVWGVYEEEKLSACFRYLEDGSFSTVDEEEYDLADEARVGLVHPVELSEEELSAWQGQLEDYEIKQPIPQLTRPVARVEPDHAGDTALESFGGKVLSSLSLSGKLLGMGWYRSGAEDAGIFYSFYREDGPIGVRLNFSGAFIGGEDSEVEVWDAEFYRGHGYAGLQNQKDRLVPLGQVPPRLYSEIVYQLQKATASSGETREDWKSRA